MKNFKHTAKLKALYSQHLNSHHLDLVINILSYPLYHIFIYQDELSDSYHVDTLQSALQTSVHFPLNTSALHSRVPFLYVILK